MPSAPLASLVFHISIEPGIYLPGVGGIRHSDTTFVTTDGFEHLTVYPTDIASITITAWKTKTRLTSALIRCMAGVSLPIPRAEAKHLPVRKRKKLDVLNI